MADAGISRHRHDSGSCTMAIPPIALMAYSPFVPGTLADEVSPSAEFVAKYTGIENVTIFAAYFHTDHNGQGVYKGYRVHEGLNTVRLWAKYAF